MRGIWPISPIKRREPTIAHRWARISPNIPIFQCLRSHYLAISKPKSGRAWSVQIVTWSQTVPGILIVIVYEPFLHVLHIADHFIVFGELFCTKIVVIGERN